MARHFSGILGSIAFSTVMLRAWLWGADLESAVGPALAALFAGGLIGFVGGKIAEQTIGESLRRRLLDQLNQRREEQATQ